MSTLHFGMRRRAALLLIISLAALSLSGCSDALGIRPPSDQILELDAGARPAMDASADDADEPSPGRSDAETQPDDDAGSDSDSDSGSE